MLEPVNCLGIIALAEQYNLDGLKASANTLAHNRFMEVSNTEEFVHLETPQLLELLSNDNINVDSEEDVFIALTKWIDFNLKSRQKHIKDLVQAIRVGQISDSVSNHHIYLTFFTYNSNIFFLQFDSF